ncbi:MAG: type IV toxin-antitoxin system AbiEi family antitoxin domain-containing protein [Verrucomicrobia bacterium]|nr:type IV toxin-antitoxin system AbiEi family antitoxin domain-containing protein [Verrucomicrobiota bacterium]
MKDHLKKAIRVFKKKRGLLRTGEALDLGIHPRSLWVLKEEGVIEKLDRGIYQLSDEFNFSEPDLILVSKMVPQGVVCLVSALSYYNLTTQVPHFVYVALKSGSRRPQVKYPPTRFFWYSDIAFKCGIVTEVIDGHPVQIYCVEKTLADCVKFRNKIGMDVVLEALKLYCKRKKMDLDKLLKFAKICRVEKILNPILETILNLCVPI